jgi:uridine phosphorylase
MLMSEADLIIEPRRGKKEKLLPPRALLVVNPSEAEYAVKAFDPFIGQTRSLYQHTKLLVDKDQAMCLAGPALGAAAAALILEKLIVLGVQEIWLVSCCGTLDPALSIGDLVLAIGGVSGEGVSRYYSPESVTFPGPVATNNLREIVRQHWGVVRTGAIWSTDAPYRERRSELIALQERYGVVGVDMEFSALCTVAAHRGVSLGALFVVSDMIWTKNWKPGFGSADVEKSSQELIGKLITRGLSKELGT